MTIWRGVQPLILASQSLARRELLANAGITFDAMPADIDERGIQQKSGLTAPGEIAALLAERKAAFISLRHPGRYYRDVVAKNSLWSTTVLKPL